MDLKIDHIHIHSSDVKRTISFYERMFDGKLVLDTMVGDLHLIRVKVGDGYINIFERAPGVTNPKPEDSPIHHFAFRVEKFDEVIEELQKRGADFAVGPRNIAGITKMAYIRAPDNVFVEVLETTAY